MPALSTPVSKEGALIMSVYRQLRLPYPPAQSLNFWRVCQACQAWNPVNVLSCRNCSEPTRNGYEHQRSTT
jgi:hypothetical protein